MLLKTKILQAYFASVQCVCLSVDYLLILFNISWEKKLFPGGDNSVQKVRYGVFYLVIVIHRCCFFLENINSIHLKYYSCLVHIKKQVLHSHKNKSFGIADSLQLNWFLIVTGAH